MKTAHQVKGKSMADNDCYGGQHFPLVAEDPAQSCRCLGCSGVQVARLVIRCTKVRCILTKAKKFSMRR